MGTRCKASALPRWLGSLRLPHFPQPRRRNRLQTINQGVGPFYSIGVGPFYVVKATNIAAIYGLEEHERTRFLVLELVEGPTLGDRIKQGAIPVEESLKLALQIGEALEAAHEKGVIHRDLKPDNIKVTLDGKVKVLDFGLAKAFAGDEADISVSNSPTLSMAATQQGVILGTAAYMSPEQAKGQIVDKRADVWAFGCVLYEMLTGRQTWMGATATDMIAAAVAKDPDFSSLPENIHRDLGNLLRRCLEKDPFNRSRCVGDIRLDLIELLSSPGGWCQPDVVSPIDTASRSMFLPVIGAVLVTALAGGLVAWMSWPTGAREVTRFSVDLEGPLTAIESIALSPDGRRIVYPANGQLYSHRIDQDTSTAISGTEGAGQPFFSPDGESLVFSSATSNQLMTVGFTGDAPQVLANTGNSFAIEGVWSGDRIIYGLAGRFDLWWVPEVGGMPQSFAELGESQDLDFPAALPGGEWVLYSDRVGAGGWSGANIVAQNESTGERRVVLEGGYYARYVPTGHLLFARNGTLFAVAFDPDRLETSGPEVPMVPGLAGDEIAGHSQFAVAANGTLVYVPGIVSGAAGRASTIVHVDRDGSAEALTLELRDYNQPRVSPDGAEIAVEVTDASSGTAVTHVWIMNRETGTATQLTFEGSENRYPVWMPDSQQVLFTSNRGGDYSIYRQAADGGGEAQVVVSGSDMLAATDVWGGSVLFYEEEDENGGRDILTVSLDGDGSIASFLATPSDERSARVSPDGRWIAYVSDENGQERVYARPYPVAAGGQRAVSEGPGVEPLWSPTGDEIFFMGNPGDIMGVAVQAGSNTLTALSPEPRFPYASQFVMDSFEYTPAYDVFPGGEGWVVIQLASLAALPGSEADAARPRIKVVLNWFEELKERVPVP